MLLNISTTYYQEVTNNVRYIPCYKIQHFKTISSKDEKADFKMIYFYTPLNNNWNSSNTLLLIQSIEKNY